MSASTVRKGAIAACPVYLPPKPSDADVYTLALERTAEVLARFDHVAVSFSGGKDSTAVLNVALEVAHSDRRFERHLPMRAIFFDEEAIPMETEEYVRRTAQRDDVAMEWSCLPVKHRNACSRKSPWWWPWAPEDRDRWCRPLPPEAFTEYPGFPVWPAEARLSIPDANGLFFRPEQGNCAMLLGIRADESMTRRRAVTRRSVDNYIVKVGENPSHGNVWKAYPIYDWRTPDVWTAPAQLGWDYNHAYDRLEMAGVSRAAQRCSPAFGEEPLQKIHTYAQCFPEVWARMSERVPGIGAAVRYALTELYSSHGQPDKPDGMPWPEFISHYLRQFRPEDAAHVAHQIRQRVGRHYRKTSNPIVVSTPYPDTGVSWSWVLKVAMRGDFKERNQPLMGVQTDDQGRAVPKLWHRYADELAGIMAAGRFAELAAPRPAPADPFALIPEYAREAALT